MKKLFHSGNVVLAGFGVMIVLMSVLVYLCTKNPAIMVSKNYYEEELTYQDKIDATNNALSFDQSLTMEKGNGQVTITIPATINQQLIKASLAVYCLTDDKKDTKIDLSPNSEGVYTVDSHNWQQGNYRLKLSMESGGKNYYKEFPF